ncbi:MAG: cation transporter [Bdellovibrionota bacterium]
MQTAKVLKQVMVINYSVFFIEFICGYYAKSTALMADSLDLLGDAAIYGISLYALSQGPLWNARAGFLKGLVMAMFGFFVLGQAIYRGISGTVPFSFTVTSIGLLALCANAICMMFLYKYREVDMNMRSTWLCSRNDIFANTGVLISAGLVALTGSGMPDVIIGFAIAALYLKTAYDVMSDAQLFTTFDFE